MGVSVSRHSTVRKSFIFFLVLLLSIFMFPVNAQAASSEDTSCPIINSISVNGAGASVKAGDTVKLSVDITEEETGFKEISIVLSHLESTWDTSITGSRTEYSASFNEAQYSGKYQIEVPIPTNALPGEWIVDGIAIKDQKNNWCSYNRTFEGEENTPTLTDSASNSSIPNPVFTVSNDVELDITRPIINSITAPQSSETVAAGSFAIFNIDITEEQSGFSKLDIELGHSELTWDAPTTGSRIYQSLTFETRHSGTYAISVPVPAGSLPGEWIVSSLSLSDNAGNYTSLSRGYNGDTEKFFLSDSRDTAIANPIITITNSSTLDTTAPKVISVDVLNKDRIVNRPGIAQVEVAFSDDLSGVEDVNVAVAPEEYCNGYGNSQQAYASAELTDEDRASGKIVINVPITEKDRTGTWQVTHLYLTDKSGNVAMFDVHGIEGDTYYHHFNFGNGEISAPQFTVKDEFTFHAEAALSHPHLNQLARNTPEGQALRILIDGDGILETKVLNAIQGRDVTLVLYKDAYQWVINGLGIKGGTKDINLNVEISQIRGTEFGINEDVVDLAFYPNGQLPASVQVRFKSDYLYQKGIHGKINLYYVKDGKYIPENGPIDLVFDGTDKWCYIQIDHNSRFVLTDKTLTNSSIDNNTSIQPGNNTNTEASDTKTSSLPLTADHAPIQAITPVCVAALLAGAAILRARKGLQHTNSPKM